MPVNKDAYEQLRLELADKNVLLVAVSKTKPVEDILALYDLGQRDFGENYVQEMVDKQQQLPPDIRWHFIGHLQRNKVKYLIPFVHLVHGVDNLPLLEEISRQGEKKQRVINCLLQVHIAREETKFGLSDEELGILLTSVEKQKKLDGLRYAEITGLMGMASFTGDKDQVRAEFRHLHALYHSLSTKGYSFQTLSMGMSSDYMVAIEEGSTLVRIGSLLFGERN